MKKCLLLYFLICNIILGLNLDHIEIEKGNKGPEIEFNYLNINKNINLIQNFSNSKDYYLIQENTNLIKETILNNNNDKEYTNKLFVNKYVIEKEETFGINWLYSSILEEYDNIYKIMGISSSYNQLKNKDYFYNLNIFFNKNWNNGEDDFLIITSIGEKNRDIAKPNSRYFELLGIYQTKYQTKYDFIYYSPYLEFDFIRYHYFTHLKKENIFITKPGVEFKKIDFYKKYNIENILNIGYKQNISTNFNNILTTEIKMSILYNKQLKFSIIYRFEKNIKDSNFHRNIGGKFEFKF